MSVIVHVEDYFDPTAGYQINELLKVSGKKDKCYLITSKDMSPFHKSVDEKLDEIFEFENNIEIIRLNSKLKISSRIILENLFNEIDKLKPDLVFLHGIGDFKDLQLFKNKKKYKIVRDCHMSWVASKNKYAKIFYKFYSLFFAKIINTTDKYDKIFALGNEEYEYLKAIGIDDEKIQYLYHGYNDEITYYSNDERLEIRSQYNLKNDDIVISYIGKFDDAKRPDIIFDIVNNFKNEILENNSLKLLFIGPKNTEYMDLFNKKVSQLNKKIEIIIDDSKEFSILRKYFSASDICIFPKETTLSSIHAQVCGCPVIMENHTSNKERVIQNCNLYKENDIESAAKITSDLITEKKYLKKNNLQIIDKIKNREYKNQIKKIENIISGKNR